VLGFSLVASAVLLVLVLVGTYCCESPLPPVLFFGPVFCLLPICAWLYLIPLMVHAVVLLIAAVIWHLRCWRPLTFLPLSLAATAAAYLIVGGAALVESHLLREQYPVVSMEERLNQPRRADRLSASSEKALEKLEGDLSLNRPFVEQAYQVRAERLKELHREHVSLFVRSFGFGVNRMSVFQPWEPHRKQIEQLPQPGDRPPSSWSPGELENLPPVSPQGLWGLHRDGVLDFVNPLGFGYFKDRRYVAGFQEHHFSQVPTTADWKVRTLDLVGLVAHERPVAYVSDQLPRMDELKKAPTRPLDAFEEIGLAALEKGEELFVRDVGGVRRMLGAVRSAKQCVGCHGGERGDLLGAFSYTLKRMEP
jgi:hypothetical protein